MARHLNLTSILDVLYKRRILFNFLLLFLSAVCAFSENFLPSQKLVKADKKAFLDQEL